MKLFYVKHMALVEVRVAIIAEDEVALKAELSVREATLQLSKLNAKVEKVSHELSQDWRGFKAQKWDGKA